MDAGLPISTQTPVGEVGASFPRVRRGLWSVVWRHAAQALLVAAVAFGSYYFISNFFLQSVRVTGVSMQPTLHNAQHCFLNRWVLHFREPHRGDIVVLRDPTDNGLAVKRVIGVEGDVVEFKGRGEIYLNGQKLKEPYLADGMPTYPGTRRDEQVLKCGKRQFVVLGDNRLNSADSRNYGPVLRQNILGLIIR